jgi:hypothetical protein
VGLLDFGALFFPAVWLGSKVGFLELLAFAICVRRGTGVGAKRERLAIKFIFLLL